MAGAVLLIGAAGMLGRKLTERIASDSIQFGRVAGWPAEFDARHAIALGFRAETSFDALIKAHIDDELGRRT